MDFRRREHALAIGHGAPSDIAGIDGGIDPVIPIAGPITDEGFEITWMHLEKSDAADTA